MTGGHIPTTIYIALVASTLLCLSSRCNAQAWVLPEGKLSMGLFYAYSDVGNHLFSTEVTLDGVNYSRSVDMGNIISHSVVFELEYGFTERISVGARLPFIVSKYDGLYPENPPVDDGVFRGGLQDIRVDVRYNITGQPAVVTPVISVILPASSYETFGHVAIGKSLRELHLGVSLGKIVPFISDNLYVDAEYEYAVVERVSDTIMTSAGMVHELAADYSLIGAEAGYFLTPYLSLDAMVSYKHTRGGLDWALDTGTESGFHDHDRFPAEDYVRIGGGISYDITDGLTLTGSYSNTVWGINTHELETFALGVTWSGWLTSGGF